LPKASTTHFKVNTSVKWTVNYKLMGNFTQQNSTDLVSEHWELVHNTYKFLWMA
jgi:hypothetical protein